MSGDRRLAGAVRALALVLPAAVAGGAGPAAAREAGEAFQDPALLVIPLRTGPALLALRVGHYRHYNDNNDL